MAQHRETERLLRQAAEDVVPFDRTRFEEWLGHNELGLAFDELVGVADESDASHETWMALALIAGGMQLDRDDPVHGASVTLVARRLGRT
jgi:hypothetical protein